MSLRLEIFSFAIFFIFKELQRKTKWKFDTIVLFYVFDDLVYHDGLFVIKQNRSVYIYLYINFICFEIIT